MPKRRLSQTDYTALASFRYLIRCFLEFSENEAKRAGMTPRHHQAILAIKGYGRGEPITIGELAERLRIRHNSAVELANRLCENGLITRNQDSGDQRRVLVQLTEAAEQHLGALSSTHLDELNRIKPLLADILENYP